MATHKGSAFGTLLRSYRLAAGLSQERLAERAGLSLRGISDLERGARTTPRLETVRMLVEGLELTPEERSALFLAAHPSPPPAHDANSEPAMARLPLPPTPLVGREDDLDRLIRVVADGESRLVTLTGPGGVGKTRLAQEAAQRLARHFPDGACFVTLVTVPDARLVLPAIANALGLQVSETKPLQAELAQFLATKHLLLVFDNFEHVLSAASLVASLLSTSAGLHVLATSRMPLQLRGERLYPLAPLGVPDAHRSYTADELDNYGAVQLLVARIRDVRPEFSLDTRNGQAIAEICRRLDGLPLALELAAVRARLLTPDALLQRLERRLPLLNGGPRDLPSHQQTLRATIAWGYDLLSPQEQVLFRNLAVFLGGWTLEAAETVAAQDGALNIIEGLASLVDASLVQMVQGVDGAPRYRMLETVREFALEQLDASHQADAIRGNLVDYFLGLAETDTADPSDAAQRRWEARMATEQGNIRSALAWLRDHGLNQKGVRLVSTLSGFWSAHSGKAEGRAWMESFLNSEIGADLSARDRIAALRILGSFAGLQDDRATVEARLQESLALARREGDTYGVYIALDALAQTLLFGGDVSGSIPYVIEAIALARSADDMRETASLLNFLAYAHGLLDNLQRAETLVEESLALSQSYGAPRGFEATVSMLVNGWLAIMAEEVDRAQHWFTEALDSSRDINVRAFESSALAGLANVAIARGQLDEARTLFHSGIGAGWDGDFPLVLVKNLMGLVRPAISDREYRRAAHLVGGIESFGDVIRSVPALLRRRHEADITELRRILGDDRFETERLRGMDLRPDEIVAEALAGSEAPETRSAE